MKTLYEMSDKQLLDEFVRFLKQDDDSFPDKEMKESFEQNILYRMNGGTCYDLIFKIIRNCNYLSTVVVYTLKILVLV